MKCHIVVAIESGDTVSIMTRGKQFHPSSDTATNSLVAVHNHDDPVTALTALLWVNFGCSFGAKIKLILTLYLMLTSADS